MGWFYIDRNGNEQAWRVGQSLPKDCRWNSARFFNQFRIAILERAAAIHVATNHIVVPLYTPFMPGDNAQSSERHAQIHTAIELLLSANGNYDQFPDSYLFVANHAEATADAIQAQAQWNLLQTKTNADGILESIPDEYPHDLSLIRPNRGRWISTAIYETWHNILTAIPHTGAVQGAYFNLQSRYGLYGRGRLYTYDYDNEQWFPPWDDYGPWDVSSYETRWSTTLPVSATGMAAQWAGNMEGGSGSCAISEVGVRLRGRAEGYDVAKSMRISVAAYPYVARNNGDHFEYRDPREHGIVEGLPAPGETSVVATAVVGSGTGYFTMIERFMENIWFRNNSPPPFIVDRNNPLEICYNLVTNIIQVQTVLEPSFPSIYEGAL